MKQKPVPGSNRLRFVVRAHRQHSSVVVVIPRTVRDVLGIKAGDLVVFTVRPGVIIGTVQKFQQKETSNATNKVNPDRGDKSR